MESNNDSNIITKLSKLIANGPGGVLISDFDDGHIPENFPRDTTKTKLVDYPMLFDDDGQQHKKQIKKTRVNIFHDALPQHLVDAAYRKTVDESVHPSWGDYVTLSQIQKYWKKQEEVEKENDEEAKQHQPATDTEKDYDDDDDDDDDLMTKLAAHYLKLTMNSYPTKQITKSCENIDDSQDQEEQQQQQPALWKQNGLDQIHGIALWGLEAKIGSQVPYHLDYAEQIRYEYNLIVPPLLAGTLQCTKDKLIGGDFLVSLEGIPHYRNHGYKGATKKKKTNQTCDNNDDENENMNMIRIPYRYNQLTCHYGNLPHSSSKIENIMGMQKRVIVGFNVFGHDFGPLVQQAPEHSEAFRRKIKSQRALNKKMSFNEIRKNKGLTKLLVLAKRERIKYEYNQSKNFIQQDLPHRLPATVQDLMTLYCNNKKNKTEEEKEKEYCWPSSPVDVQVFLHHQVQDGKLQIINMESLPIQTTTSSSSRTDLVSPMALIDLPPHTLTSETRQ